MAKAEWSAASDWRDGFLFIGNHLALDFLNTCPVQDGKQRELLADFDALLRWFRVAGQIGSRQADALKRRWDGSARARSLTSAIHDFREDLRKAVLAWEEAGELHRSLIDELNAVLASHPMLTRLKRDARHTTTELWFDPRQPEDLFAPLAHAAALLFVTADARRVRRCGHCVLHFYDTSKKGTRRWCSMQLCGNRSKVAAYAARQRIRTRG